MQNFPADHIIHDTLRQLLALYVLARGWCCIAYIDGDPRHEKPGAEIWEWYTPRRAIFIARRIVELGAQYGNVYIGLCLHSKTQRRIETALPSPWLWNDDGPEGDHGFNMVIRSSERSRQVYYRLDQPLDVHMRRRLQKRMGAVLDSGAGSADAIKLVRVVGGFNTKRGDHYPVQLELLNDESYTVAELTASWPIASQPEADVELDLDWAAVARWQRNLDRVCRCVKGARVPSGAKDATQTTWILTEQFELLPDKLRAEIHTPDGVINGSIVREVVAKGMRAVGYPDEVIAAFLIEECDYGRSERRGMEDLKRVVVYAIARAHQRWPDRRLRWLPRLRDEGTLVQPLSSLTQPSAPTSALSHSQEPIQQAVVVSSPRQAQPLTPNPHRPGRRKTYTADDHLLWYDEKRNAWDRALLSQRETAKERGIGAATVARLDAELTRRKLIVRETYNDRQCGLVIITDAGRRHLAHLRQVGGAEGGAHEGHTQPEAHNSPVGQPPTNVLSEPDVLSESSASTAHDVLSKITIPLARDVLSECTCSQNAPSQDIILDSIQTCVSPYPPDLRARPEVPLPGVDLSLAVQSLKQSDQEPRGQGLPEPPEPIVSSDHMPTSGAFVPSCPTPIASLLEAPLSDAKPAGARAEVCPVELNVSVESSIRNHQPPLTVPEIVRDGIDAYGPNLQLVHRYVADNADGQVWSDEAITWHYRAELQRRKWARKAAKVAEEMRVMRWSELKRRATSAGRYAAELHRRGDQRWLYWNWYSGQLEAEITRRLEHNPKLK